MQDETAGNAHVEATHVPRRKQLGDQNHPTKEVNNNSNARRHHTVTETRSCGKTGNACKPGYMGKNATDRRKARRREAAAKAAAVAKEQVLIERWESRIGALDRVSAISRRLDEMRAEEMRLLLERDDLVVALRDVDVPWTHLAARTGLSRQALNKRLAVAADRA